MGARRGRSDERLREGAQPPTRLPHSSGRWARGEAGRMSACAKEPNRQTGLLQSRGMREAGRMSACAEEPYRQTEVFQARGMLEAGPLGARADEPYRRTR